MTSQTPAHDFLLPRLMRLVRDAQKEGISRDVAVAVLIDLVTGPGFNDTPLDPREDTAPMRGGMAAGAEMDLDRSVQRVERGNAPDRHEHGSLDPMIQGGMNGDRIGLSDV